SQLQKVPPEWK
nr:vasoactive 11-peptide [Homo sapiens]